MRVRRSNLYSKQAHRILICTPLRTSAYRARWLTRAFESGAARYRLRIFGPVVCAMPFDELDQVATQMNQTTYGLAGAVWTKDVSKAHRMARAMKAGTVWINCYNIFDAALPFGGYKQSGWGREMGREALELYTEVKSVCLKM